MSIRSHALFLILSAIPILAQPPSAAPARQNTKNATPVSKSQGMTVDGVLAMVEAGLSDDVIIARLRKEDKAFDLSSDDMIRLKKAKVSDAVLMVMLDPKAVSKPEGANIAPAGAVRGQNSKAGRRPSAFTEIKWQDYTFKFLPGGQMAQVFNAEGKVAGTILKMNGELQIIPLPGADSDKLKKAFEAWKAQDAGNRSGDSIGSAPAASSPPAVIPAGPPNSPAAPQPPAAAPEQSGPGFGILDKDTVDRLGNSTVRLDLNLLRLDPTLLDEKAFMRYFIALNNCRDQSVGKMLDNELDYPKAAAFYKAKAPEILKSVPDYVGLGFYKPTGTILWGRSATTGAAVSSLTLGEYNTSKKAFPLIDDQAKRVEIAGNLTLEADRRDINKVCPVAQFARSSSNEPLPSSYTVTFKALSFSELPMDEAAARKYIESVGPSQRIASLNIEIHLLDTPPRMARSGSRITRVEFGGEIGRVTVVKRSTDEAIGVLYDNHTLPAPQAPANNPAPPGASTAPTDNQLRLEISTVIYVGIASDTCGWPLSADQGANIRRYIDATNASNKFNPKYWLNSEFGQVRSMIERKGRLDFCADRLERRKFEQRAASIWPQGTVATPPGK